MTTAQKDFLSGTITLILFAIFFYFAIPAWLNEEHNRYAIRQKNLQERRYNGYFEVGNKIKLPNGQKGVVNKECWFSFNNYEIRLQDGSMTLARGSELTSIK